MKFAVVQFPGSNCDYDLYQALKKIFNLNVEYVSFKSNSLDEFDGAFLPGGFSYGDYLRPGAIARFTNIMQAIKRMDKENKLIIGICNGFQILTEAKLLPGALKQNQSLKFVCKTTPIKVENTNTPFTNQYKHQNKIKLPIAHGDGNYFAEDEVIEELETNHQVVFRYQANPNGSKNNIAGIINKKGNVLGMMPHPERAVDQLLGNSDGKKFFESIIDFVKNEAIYE